MRLLRALLTLAIATVASAGVAQDRPTVVTVNYALQYLAERLLEDDADVIFPVPPDQDPSFWRPSISDISLIQSADMIILNGAGFATWVDRVSLPRSKVVNTTNQIEDRFIVSESVTHSHGDGGEHSHEGLASYTWLDPTLALSQVDAMASQMTRLGLSSEEQIASRLAGLRQDLSDLDARASQVLSDMQSVAMIASHPRYQYFARRYGLSISYLEWESTVVPSQSDLTALQDLVTETGARILIWEGTPPEAAIAATAEMGLQNIVFPPMSHKPGDMNFLDAFAMSVDRIATGLLH